MTATVSAPTGFEPLDPAIREQYDRDGFVVIPNALPEADRAYFEDAVDRIYGEEEAAGELRPDRSIHVMGWMHKDPRFVELLNWPQTFPYIWGTMGWNIYTHHNHIDVNPPKDEPRQPQEQHARRPPREGGRPDHRARGRRRGAAQPR